MGWLSRYLRQKDESFFDHAHYLKAYPDVARAGVGPFDHFSQSGWREGRNPSADFVTLFYLDEYLPGVSRNPLIHFSEVGNKLRFKTVPRDKSEYIGTQRAVCRHLFSTEFYVAQLGHIPSEDPLTHYLKDGWRLGLSPFRGFDPSLYLQENRYITDLEISPLYHFASLLSRKHVLSGIPSVRERERLDSKRQSTASERPQSKQIRERIAPSFDAKYYLSKNPDVVEAGVDPLDHYIKYGWRENRKPHPLFDPGFYLGRMPDLLEFGIEPFDHYLRIGRRKGMRPNPIGKRLYAPLRAPEAKEWEGLPKVSNSREAKCVIIMPVYRGRDEVLASIFSVISSKQKTSFVLHVFNDCSPDSVLTRDLMRLSETGLFLLDENEVNLGFVKTVNRALRMYQDQPVILLNADVQVSGDWIDRLLSHAESDKNIATITPFSNNGTIFGYPLINENNIIELEHGVAELDQLASLCNAGRLSDMPTGVGFCYFMSAASRKAIGLFDEEAFGRGYGEENDFCLRASKHGFRNVIAEDCFVYHVGEVSFGSPDAVASAPGQRALIAKHPDYPERLLGHLRSDDSEMGRVRLDLMRIAATAGSQSVIFVYHALTGGVIVHILQEEERLRKAGIKAIHLRVGVGSCYNIEVRPGGDDFPFCPNLRPFSFAQFRHHLEDFITWLRPAVIHIHSLVGFEWTATLGFLDIVRCSNIPYRFTLHDYSIVCHRNNLVLPNFRYCGLPDVASCRECVIGDRAYPEAIDPSERREVFERFLARAECVFAPSHDIAKRLRAAGARYEIAVLPHESSLVQKPIARAHARGAGHKGEQIIVVVGAIGPHKGSRLLLSLARDVRCRNLPIRFHIVGYSDIPTELKAVGVDETGRYVDDEDAKERILALAPALIFLPSIWPETYSYTLSLAFAARIPPVVLDIGAPADRIREAGFGEIVPYKLIENIGALNDKLIELSSNDAIEVSQIDL